MILELSLVESKSDIYMAEPIKWTKKGEQGIVRTYLIRYIENNAFKGAVWEAEMVREGFQVNLRLSAREKRAWWLS
jgi:hypothetical protein